MLTPTIENYTRELGERVAKKRDEVIYSACRERIGKYENKMKLLNRLETSIRDDRSTVYLDNQKLVTFHEPEIKSIFDKQKIILRLEFNYELH
jgi:hypothetical protein